MENTTKASPFLFPFIALVGAVCFPLPCACHLGLHHLLLHQVHHLLQAGLVFGVAPRFPRHECSPGPVPGRDSGLDPCPVIRGRRCRHRCLHPIVDLPQRYPGEEEVVAAAVVLHLTKKEVGDGLHAHGCSVQIRGSLPSRGDLGDGFLRASRFRVARLLENHIVPLETHFLQYHRVGYAHAQTLGPVLVPLDDCYYGLPPRPHHPGVHAHDRDHGHALYPDPDLGPGPVPVPGRVRPCQTV